jgi:hypothetical protein
MKIRYVGALLFVATLSVSCAVDDVEESSEEQELGAGCTLYRPLGWDQNGAWCVEWASGPLSMADGDYYTAYSSGGGWYGHGHVTIKCNNDSLEQISLYCRPGIEP